MHYPQVHFKLLRRQALAEAISMSKGLEPLLAAKETKNKPTKYRGTCDGIIDGWMMLTKRYLEKAHAKDTSLDKVWTIVEFLEYEARNYITNKCGAERDTDEKVFALLARRFRTGRSRIHIQQQFRTRNQTSDEDYMQYLDALEGLFSQGFPKEKIAVRRYEIMQKFIDGVLSFELKRNLALMFAQEKSARTDHYLAVPQQQAPPQNELNQAQQKTDHPLVPSAHQVQPQPVAYG